jgi:tetratricopeptide (TPR) repeat protein
MKSNFRKTIVSLGLVIAPFVLEAQNKFVTDAGMRIKKYNPMANGVEPSKKLVEEAKSFIDQAQVTPDAKDYYKMHYYKGQIYFALIELASFEASSSGKMPDENVMKGYSEIVKSSFAEVMKDPKKGFVKDVEDFINPRAAITFEQAVKLYNDKKFDQATVAFIGSYEIQKYIGKENKDALTNATLSLSNAVDAYIRDKKFDEAIKLANAVNETVPGNIDVQISLINICLQKGDMAEAEKYLNAALALDPNNKQLYYVLGTSLIDLKQNERAEETLNKALAIDPNYSEAQYQLGAHLFNWANDLKYQAGQLDYKDPRGPEMEKQATAILNRAIIVLEKYIEKNPNEKAVLDILYKVHYKLENTDKAMEYKKRLDALK